MMALDVAANLRRGEESHDLPLMFGILCHDFGKPPTSVYSEEKKRIVSNNHDQEGVKPARAFLKRIRASEELVAHVAVLVAEHLKPFMLIKSKAGPKAYRKLQRRMKGVPMKLLADVATADSEGRICNDSDHQTAKDIDLFLKKVEEAGIDTQDGNIPKDVVMGRHLLSKGMKPGPEVGEILKRCREVQGDTGITDSDKILEMVLSNKVVDAS